MKNHVFVIILLSIVGVCQVAAKSLWSIGEDDGSAKEFALAPDRYKDYLIKDFGYEDRYFLVGYSNIENDFPYVLPGPSDTWGGTGDTSGWRTHEATLLFGIDNKPIVGKWELIIDVLDNSVEFPPLLKVSVNEKSWKFQLPEGKNVNSIKGNLAGTEEYLIRIPLDVSDMKVGGNEIRLSVLQGSWILFDRICLEGPEETKLINPHKAFVRAVYPADYEIQNMEGRFQPLLVDVEELDNDPVLSVELDGKEIFVNRLDTARYIFEVPMPAVAEDCISEYVIKIDGKSVNHGRINRKPMRLQTPADYVDTRIGSGHSRWMIAPGPWMPFSMVKLSPDNQNMCWQAGYQPTFEHIACFSHLHEWTIAGIGMMPTNGKLITLEGDEMDVNSGYRSRINKSTEQAKIGYYAVHLEDYDIQAELTSTTRCGFQRYTFPKYRDNSRVLVDFHIQAEYDYELKSVEVKQVSPYRIEGKSHQFSAEVWSHDAEQDYTVYFVLEFDQPISSMGGWIDDKILILNELKGENMKDAGIYLTFDTKKNNVVQVRSGISMVSIKNASQNLETEVSCPFGWNFEGVVQHQKDVWNELFSRLEVTSSDRHEKVRFYNNMYRALCSRNIFSDVNGEWVSTDGKVRQMTGKDRVALGCDAFWNTFWNLNQFWNLVTPEWTSRWVHSQLAMYDANGWLAKGPAGMNYIPVMVAEHEIPLIVGAYQMGIRDFDLEKAFKAMVKMQSVPAKKVFKGFAGNRDLVSYLKYGYVPSDLGRFSNSLEYAYDDWVVGQYAKALGKHDAYRIFNDRGYWWKNIIEPSQGYAMLKNSKGKWLEDFDPFRSGANTQYVEGNAWQLTYFVPQNIPELAKIIGKDRFSKRLQWGFQVSEPWRYNAPNDQYWDYPVVQGNQQSMHFAFLFNWVGKPWLTQHWSRSIIDRYYGYGISNAYLGDEDQGQMSAWFLMAALGLFQTDGGCSCEPVYEISSPIFEKVIIHLDKKYNRGDKFVIEAKNVSRHNKYIQSAILNGKTLNSFKFPVKELLKGGSLILYMGNKPNEKWGLKD